MSILLLIFLGIVQGLAEFLPVSSSGHLAFLENILKLSESQRLSYTVFLHLGTTLALLFYFRKKIFEIILNSFRHSGLEKQKESLNLILMIIIGTLPIAILGYFAKDKIEHYFQLPYYPALFLLITGIILFGSKFSKERKSQLTYFYSFLIGIAQAIALLPGISRSGITISFALLLGLSRTNSFEFSFLLSIPAIIGANILLMKNITLNLTVIPLLLSIIIPFTIGLLALFLLKKLVLNKKLHYFSYYCWILGITVLLLIILF